MTFSRVRLIKFLSVAALLAGLIFFSRTGIWQLVREAVVRSSSRIMIAAMSTARLIGISSSRLSEEEILQLIRENQHLKASLLNSEELARENSVLKKALGFKDRNKLLLKTARVLLYSRELGKEFLLVDQGRASGIEEGALVVDAENIFVGIVVQAGDNFAKVEIAVSPGAVYEVEIMPLGQRALARGQGGRAFGLELIPADAVIRRGDLVALLGSHPFLLGEVLWERTSSNTAFKEAGAILLSRPEALREVFLVEPEPRK